MPDEHIRIKRYPNRRFYASHTSKYVSLSEIEQLIRDGSEVEIVDSQTGEELTRTVLVQIIAEKYPDKFAIFPTAMLHSILRANDAMVDFLQEYFQNSLAYLDRFQVQGTPSVEQPIHWMKAWLDQWPKPPSANRAPKPADKESDGAEAELAERIAGLEKRIAELEMERGNGS